MKFMWVQCVIDNSELGQELVGKGHKGVMGCNNIPSLRNSSQGPKAWHDGPIVCLLVERGVEVLDRVWRIHKEVVSDGMSWQRGDVMNI